MPSGWTLVETACVQRSICTGSSGAHRTREMLLVAAKRRGGRSAEKARGAHVKRQCRWTTEGEMRQICLMRKSGKPSTTARQPRATRIATRMRRWMPRARHADRGPLGRAVRPAHLDARLRGKGVVSARFPVSPRPGQRMAFIWVARMACPLRILCRMTLRHKLMFRMTSLSTKRKECRSVGAPHHSRGTTLMRALARTCRIRIGGVNKGNRARLNGASLTPIFGASRGRLNRASLRTRLVLPRSRVVV